MLQKPTIQILGRKHMLEINHLVIVIGTYKLNVKQTEAMAVIRDDGALVVTQEQAKCLVDLLSAAGPPAEASL